MPHEAMIDAPALSRWLDANAPEIGDGPLTTTFLHGGTSNVILALDRGGAPAVLRRPPAVPPPNSERAMMREARLLAALRDTDVPHPRLYGWCDDISVIGAPFYVMARIDGWAPEVTAAGCVYPPAFDAPRHRRAMGFALADAAAALARVDHHAVGLSDFGRPGNFLARQVDRWLTQFASYPRRYPGYVPRALPGMDRVVAWLRANIPAHAHIGILHGDYGPPNLLFGNEEPLSVAAIVDWELATIGDPLLDMALFCVNLMDADRPGEIPPAAYFDPTDFPTRQEVLARYAAGTGYDLANIAYYLILAQFRMACILEYKVAALEGREPEGNIAIFPDMVVNLMRQAEAMIPS